MKLYLVKLCLNTRSSSKHSPFRFTSDRFDNMLGFMIQYDTDIEGETIRFGCGGNFTTEKVILTSPSFTYNYPEDQNCIYTISVPADRLIDITFSTLDIKCNEDVGSDFIEIRDGSTENSPLMTKECSDGNRIPTTMQSTQNFLWIK